MQAAVIHEHGSYDKIKIEDIPTPTLKQEAEPQYLIAVKACGLNHLDIWVRRGVPGHRFPLPMVPGSDITGVIAQSIDGTGARAKFKEGDSVIVNPALFCGTCTYCQRGDDHLCNKWGLLGETISGGCQEYIILPEKMLWSLPGTVSFEQGACIPINYVTAWEMLMTKAKIQKGESILIHSAGSGVSVACIQIAKLMGLQIIVTSTSEQKLQRSRSLGASRFIDTSKSDFVEDVKNLTGKAGVDVVVDHVGAPTIMNSIRCLKKGGRLVSCGATAGAKVEIDWKHVFFKNIALLGSTYGSRRSFQEVLDRFAHKELQPVIDTRISLKDLSVAHEAIETRKVFGKIVVKF